MIFEKTEVLFCYGKYPILILMKTPIVLAFHAIITGSAMIPEVSILDRSWLGLASIARIDPREVPSIVNLYERYFRSGLLLGSPTPPEHQKLRHFKKYLKKIIKTLKITKVIPLVMVLNFFYYLKPIIIVKIIL